MIITTTMHIENKPVQHSRCTKWHAYDYMQWYSRCSLINNRLSQI